LIFIFFSVISVAQTATDFTTDDCNGVTHNLFDSLDMGNVIVIAWVMPCGPCATYASFAYSAVQSFVVSHPGKVDFYLVDDYANTSCINLVNWGNSNNIPLHTAFSSSNISMSDYGANGMPKVVVLGGTDHNIFYNTNDNQIDFSGVHSAINDALSAPLDVNNNENSNFGLFAFPNPANNFLNIEYETNNQNITRFEIVDVLGKILLLINDPFSSAVYSKKLDISSLEKGVYFLNAYSGADIKTIRFIVANKER
jgi:hypothetical protein